MGLSKGACWRTPARDSPPPPRPGARNPQSGRLNEKRRGDSRKRRAYILDYNTLLVEPARLYIGDRPPKA